jgi:two-component system, NtrC family, sensor kinase
MNKKISLLIFYLFRATVYLFGQNPIVDSTGIPQKVVDKIFQPFFTTKPTGQGTGLGLSLSYDIIKAHGGEIKVESNEREGTRFTISLPT